MNETSTKLFTCEICGKGFEEKRPKIRHASYCRKRLRYPPQPRKKSCVACTKAKTSCDRNQDNPCSACLRKGTICRYEDGQRPRPLIAARSRAPPSRSDATSNCSASGPKMSSKKHRSSAGSTQADVDLDEVPQSLHGAELVGALDQRFAGTRTGDVFRIAPVFNFFEPFAASLSPSHSIQNASSYMQRPLSLSGELPLKPYRAFNTRLSTASQSSLLAKYVLSTLCSYSRMNIGENQLPPFIHTEGVRQGKKVLACSSSHRMFDRLAACSAITTWWSKNTEDRQFMWNAIRMEQERLFDECLTYDDWQAVVALQAICVYLLLRLAENDENKKTFDIPLIRTMSKITARVRGLTAKYAGFSNPDSAWERWILVESLRRTLIVVLIIGYLFDMTPGYEDISCADDKYLREMLLPSTASLWSAATREAWEKQYLARVNVQQPCFEDLLWHSQGSSESDKSLDLWLADVDSLGTLIIAVATLGRSTPPSDVRKDSSTLGFACCHR